MPAEWVGPYKIFVLEIKKIIENFCNSKKEEDINLMKIIFIKIGIEV